jgi:hypothetical protein
MSMRIMKMATPLKCIGGGVQNPSMVRQNGMATMLNCTCVLDIGGIESIVRGIVTVCNTTDGMVLRPITATRKIGTVTGSLTEKIGIQEVVTLFSDLAARERIREHYTMTSPP